jgi:putative transport protein
MLCKILSNQFFLIFLTILTGSGFGKVKIGEFKLGFSGVLFAGLFEGWLVTTLLKRVGYFSETSNLNISGELFHFSLILFISGVGLLAGKDIGRLFKKYGFKFLFLGFFMTFIGMILTLITEKALHGNKYIFMGMFTGALTSSPGLAAALDVSSATASGKLVGYGYALGYVPGVLVVVIFMDLMSTLLKSREPKDAKLSKEMKREEKSTFDFMAFSLVIIIGIVLGKLKISSFSLGLTGGTLTSSLFFGYLKKLGPLDFSMNKQVLNSIKNFGLLLFLSIVGVKYGYTTVTSFNSSGIIYMSFAFLISFISILSGFLIVRLLFKMNWNLLAGALCGGMTSTPGLGAALDNTKSEETVGGYGAVYPFALLGMIIFVMLINLS